MTRVYLLAHIDVDPQLVHQLGEIAVSCLPLATKRVLDYQLETIESSVSDSKLTVITDRSAKADIVEELVRGKAEVIRLDGACDFLRTVQELVLPREDAGSEIIVIDGGCLPYYIPQKTNYIALARSCLHWSQPVFHYSGDDPMYFSGMLKLTKTLDVVKAFSEPTLERALRQLNIDNDVELIEVPGAYGIEGSLGYFSARKQYTSERAFNNISIVDNVLEKTSSNERKMAAEQNWYKSVPDALRPYVPNYYGSVGSNGYRLEYLPALPLNELFVYGDTSINSWKVIFHKLKQYFSVGPRGEIDNTYSYQTDLRSMLVVKTEQRLKDLEGLDFFSLDQEYSFNGYSVGTIRELLNTCYQAVDFLPEKSAFFHGDLCLSNIIFEPITQSIKIFDPRGQGAGGDLCVFGNPLYDLLKLSHSILGLYDFIIAESYTLKVSDFDFELSFDEPAVLLDVQNMFLETAFLENFETRSVLPVLPLLFISMLPLHSDSQARQRALFANALRIYQEVK